MAIDIPGMNNLVFAYFGKRTCNRIETTITLCTGHKYYLHILNKDAFIALHETFRYETLKDELDNTMRVSLHK